MKIEIRSKNEMIVSGYVNAVERDSRVLADIRHGKFVEKVKAKTFERALARNPCIELRFNHGKVIGDTKTNLQLYEDSIGLFAKATITDTEVISKAKELRGWSFGFTDNKPSWDDSGEVSKRTLEDISLKEVSILTKTPAYIGTSVEVRDNEVLITETRGTEDNVTDFSEHKNYKQTFEFYKLKGSTIL